MTNYKANPPKRLQLPHYANTDLYRQMAELTSRPRYGSRAKMMERIELLKRYGKVTVKG
jgi:hypothetical protein